METKINIAKILKNKPEGTKLWTDMFGSVTLYVVTDVCDAFQVKHHNKYPWFDEDGKLYKEGVLCIYPSKSMRDWEKFSWKRGDVLISDCGFVCIFKEWASDDYTKFNGCYFDGMPNAETAKYSKLDNNTAYGYIREIENRCGGKLNLETLEIEKKLEFKDGDIVVYGKSVAICRKIYKHTICFYVSLNEMVGLLFDDEVESSEEYRFATEEEKQQLFSALAKENKAWDAEKKQIVDLSKKCEFKPMDWCLMRDIRGEECFAWSLCQFAYQLKRGKYEAVGGMRFDECIPYNEETAHLLGTTDEWKGGEG